MTNEPKTPAERDYQPLSAIQHPDHDKGMGWTTEELLAIHGYARTYYDLGREKAKAWMQLADQRAIEVAELKVELGRLRALAASPTAQAAPAAVAGPSEAPDERAAFEAWGRNVHLGLERIGNRPYYWQYARWAWDAWQARAALTAAPQPPAEAQEPCGVVHYTPNRAVAHWYGDPPPPRVRLYTHPAPQSPAQAQEQVQEPVAYLDIGAGRYMGVGTDLTDDQLAALPKGRHMLAIIGTYGVDGFRPAPQQASLFDLERLRNRIARIGLDVDRALRGEVNEDSPLGVQRLRAVAAPAAPTSEQAPKMPKPEMHPVFPGGEPWPHYPDLAVGQRVRVHTGEEGVIESLRASTKKYQVLIHPGYGGQYGSWEVTPIAAPASGGEAQAEGDARDAARYRELRDCNSGSLVIMQITGMGEDDWHVLTEDDADAAIDAAMAAKSQKGAA